MKVKKGIIAAAGLGTRFLPATKAMPKEILPIIDKPIIQYTVEEFYDSGLRTIIIVTGQRNNAVIEEYFDINKFKKYKNLNETTKKLWEILNECCISFVKQRGPYGNGTPLLSAKELLGDEPFIYAFGDDLILSKTPFTQQLINNYDRYGSCVVGGQEVPKEDVVKYGILRLKDKSEKMELDGIVEKPSIENAPSRLAVFGRFLLFPKVVEILDKTPLGKNNEKWMTDALDAYLKNDIVTVQPVENGRWHTTGDPLTFLQTVIQYALENKEIGTQFKEYLRGLQGRFDKE